VNAKKAKALRRMAAAIALHNDNNLYVRNRAGTITVQPTTVKGTYKQLKKGLR